MEPANATLHKQFFSTRHHWPNPELQSPQKIARRPAVRYKPFSSDSGACCGTKRCVLSVEQFCSDSGYSIPATL
jgi:hypothetical protein